MDSRAPLTLLCATCLNLADKDIPDTLMRQSFINLPWLKVVAALLTLNALLLIGQFAWNAAPHPGPIEAPTPTVSASVDQPFQRVVPSPAPAIQASLWWNSEVANRDLWLVKQMHFSWVKQTFPWREIEIGRGEFEWKQADQVVAAAEAQGLYVLARLGNEPEWSRSKAYGPGVHSGPPDNYDDFGTFCFTIASRYRGRSIKAYQVWNEPNLAREWSGDPPDPAAYTRLLAACSQGIRRGDPTALIISAGLAPTGTSSPEAIPDDQYFQAMYDAGADGYFDMLGVNAPGYAAPPQTSPDEAAQSPEWGGYRWACFRHVEDIRQIMLANGKGDKQIAITEMGWTLDKVHPEYSWFAVSERNQAEYLAGAYWWARLNWQPWIGIMTTIYLADPAWTPDDEEYWWAINIPAYPEPATRPAYAALRVLPSWDKAFYNKWGR